MPRYHVSVTTPAATSNNAYCDLRTNSTVRANVVEIGFFSTAATANTVSLERSTTLGTTSTTVVPQAGDPADVAATAVVGTAWSGAPASTAVPMRAVVLAANVSAGVIWTFAEGDLMIPVSASLLLMNRGGSTGAVARVYITYIE